MLYKGKIFILFLYTIWYSVDSMIRKIRIALWVYMYKYSKIFKKRLVALSCKNKVNELIIIWIEK